jgi:hypothetical protein
LHDALFTGRNYTVLRCRALRAFTPGTGTCGRAANPENCHKFKNLVNFTLHRMPVPGNDRKT